MHLTSRACLFSSILAVAAGCSDSDGSTDGGLFPDTFGSLDTRRPDPDGGPSCQLGLPDSCATCSDVCPGRDDGTSIRTCTGRTCGVTCKGEHYDVDGDLSNGCEAEDDTPLHETAETAKDLGSVNDCDNEGDSVTGHLPSDERKHLDDPQERPNGRADFYSLRIEDEFGVTCGFDPYFRLDASKMPGNMVLELKVTFTCDGDDGEVTTAEKTAVGGTVAEIELDADCPGMVDDDSGTALIEVRKKSGKGHSSAIYTLGYHG